ncbi:YqgQ family protein [Amphibacillus sp. Q70]|uniref:YqgQ family protein n=1 Tax=Amphibacillus sp. Q70 TaxID=3453416 RepID=UPI003F82C91C
METYYDVKQLLLKYGIVTYIGNKEAEIILARIELKSLKDEGVLLDTDYERAYRILLKEQEKEER